MNHSTIEDRLKSYGTVLEESLDADVSAQSPLLLGSNHRRTWVKPALRVSFAAAVVLVAVLGIRALTSDIAITDIGPVADGSAPSGIAGSRSAITESTVDQCRQGFLLPDGAGVLNGQEITAGDIYRADAVVIPSLIRPAVAYVFLPTNGFLVTCRIATRAHGGLFVSVNSVGEMPDSESIKVWGAGSETPDMAVGGPTVLNIFGRVGTNVTGVSVVIDGITTDGALDDGWFLMEASVSDVSNSLDWRDVFVRWTTQDNGTTGGSLTDLYPKLGLTAGPLRPQDVIINRSPEAILGATQTWINQLGLVETDPVIWTQRLQRACTAGVWNDDVGLALASEFIAADLDKSARSPSAAEPTAAEGANSLWIMAAQVCPDEFPPGEFAAGPPSR